MRRPTLLTILLAVAILAGAGTSWARVVVTTSSGGNWNDTMSWIGPAPGPADDALILAGASVTVTANANVHSITFSNNSTATATITVNSGVTLAVAAGVTNQNSATANTSALLQGSGIITCTAITVGGTTTPTRSSSDFTATLTSTVSNLNDSGALTVRALYNSSVSSANQGTFALSSGTVTAPNVAFVTVPFFGPILTLATGSQSGTLILSNAAPFTFSGGGSSTFTPNGTNATVVYTGAAQAVSSATYQNLTFAGSGTKTNTGVTVNGLLLMQGTAKASVAPTYGSNATLEYNGSSLQTNGAELAALLPNLTISNASGVTLTNNTTISNVLTFVNGLIVTGSKNLIIGTNGSTSGGSSNSYVNGTLQKNFKVGTQTFFFPVGDTEFAPLTLSNLSVTAAGTILVSTQPGVPSQITSSGISTNQLVNRSWNLTNSGGTFGIYGATFNYPTNDVGTNAAPALFEVGLFNGGNFSYATVSGTPTTTSASISGESGFGTFAMGDPPSQATQLAITSINGGVSPVVGAPFTVTIQSQNGGAPSPVGQGTAIKLTLHSGSGVLGGTLVGTIPAWSNSVTITGVTYSVAQSGVQLTAAVTSGQSLSSTNSSSFTVIPQNQTITFPSPGNQTYGVAPITLTATASSGLPITYSVTSGPATVSGSVLTITGAGSVTIQAAQSGNVNWNAATPVSQTISVAQKTVTGSFTAKNKTYDGTLAATNATTGLSGVINSDVVNLTIGTVAFTDKNVGNGKTVIASGLGLSGANAGNYTLTSTSATNTANITAATLTVTANNTNRVYGVANPVFTASYSGFVNGENSSVLSGTPSVTSTATAGSSVAGSPYAITAAQGTLSAANYTFTFVNGNLTVTAAALTVTANNTNRVYGAANPAFTASYSGFVNGENSSVLSGAPSVTSTATAGSSVAGSPYAITATQGTLSAANYTFTFVNGN
ncbi:MAG TPA: MBG domain-containing protein, partial [Verrucomicrobiae bacterium]|nr:MBG domain-containing protein [Verrucomicrobiae bacterium]